jgi:hypothetical protein
MYRRMARDWRLQLAMDMLGFGASMLSRMQMIPLILRRSSYAI